jgi:CubicO group peptidase (beta-lactamase class C family)
MNRLISVQLMLVLLLLGGSFGAISVESLAQDDERVYEDPQRRFTVPVPATWSVEEHEGYVSLIDPEGDVTMSFVVVPAADARQGIAAAWALVAPDSVGEPLPGMDQDVPSDEGIDETVVITYDVGQTSGMVIQAWGLRVGDEVHVMLFQGSLQASVRRDAQIQVIGTGWEITGQEATDLTGSEPAPFSGELVEEFETFANSLLTELEVPGVSVVVVQDGAIVYSSGFGVKEQGGSDPVTPDTLMMIGSITKPLTTTMMATMVDEGLFSWDTPVVDILPSFKFADPELARQITMRHLVCACTGVPRRDHELNFNANGLTAEEIIASLATFEQYTDFGESFQYSNQMVAAGGYVAALAAGGIYGDLDDAYTRELQSRVLDPLGMERTTLSLNQASDDVELAVPHGTALDGTREVIPLEYMALLEPVKPSSTLWSTANELGQFLIMQLAEGVAPDGARIVSAENLLETRDPQVETATGSGYGLGWFVEDYHGLTVVSHGGNTFGFTADLASVPEAGLGIAILSNAQTANLLTELLRYRFLELVYDQPRETDQTLEFTLESLETSIAEMMQSLGDPPALADVSQYLGSYTEPALGQIELTWDEDHGLRVDAGEFVTTLRPLADAGPGEPNFVSFDPPIAGIQVLLVIRDDGQPELTLSTGADIYQFEMVEPAAVDAGTPEAVESPVASPVGA